MSSGGMGFVFQETYPKHPGITNIRLCRLDRCCIRVVSPSRSPHCSFHTKTLREVLHDASRTISKERREKLIVRIREDGEFARLVCDAYDAQQMGFVGGGGRKRPLFCIDDHVHELL